MGYKINKIYIGVKQVYPYTKATGITIDKSSIALGSVGATSQLTATVTPSGATNKDITWNSSDTSVATVSNTGLVTCVSFGTCTITATSDGSGLTANCSVVATPTESIVYRMNANSSGQLVVPTYGMSTGSGTCSYNWNISIDGGTPVNRSGTGSSSGITFGGYTAGSSHTITITPVTESYQWARAYAWRNNSNRTLLTEIIYDGSYMGYAQSATNTGAYFRANQYNGCTALTYAPDEVMPNTVTTIDNNFRSQQFEDCTGLQEAPAEATSTALTTIYNQFKMYQYNRCTGIKHHRGFICMNKSQGNNYRNNAFYNCTGLKTMKILSDVGSYSDGPYGLTTAQLANITKIYVPSAYLSNFKNTSLGYWSNFNDSVFVGY